jgi:tetratricopeptide (TPR) repeat protein
MALARHQSPAERPSLLARYVATDLLIVTSLAERARGRWCGFGALWRARWAATRAALETAVDYANAGLFEEAAAVLDRLVDRAPDKTRIDPIVHYLRAHVAEQLGDSGRAAGYRTAARAVSLDYAFPFQAELIPVLERAMAADARDAHAPYLLGNLLFDHQPDRAVALWEKAVRLRPAFTVALRNLALARAPRHEGGLRSRDHVARARGEVGRQRPCTTRTRPAYEASGAKVEKRLAMMESHRRDPGAGRLHRRLRRAADVLRTAGRRHSSSARPGLQHLGRRRTVQRRRRLE